MSRVVLCCPLPCHIDLAYQLKGGAEVCAPQATADNKAVGIFPDCERSGERRVVTDRRVWSGSLTLRGLQDFSS